MSPHLQNRIISINNYETVRVVLNDSKLKNNPVYVSKMFNIPLEKIIAIIDEYDRTGCVILNSKINGRYKID